MPAADLYAEPAQTLGLGVLVRAVADAPSLAAVSDVLHLRLGVNSQDAGARLDIATLVMLAGDPQKGLRIQAEALGQRRSYRRIHGRGNGPRLLAFMAAGDLMANIPVDFLLEGSDVTLTCVYLDGPPPPFERLPEHDVALLAIGQSEASDPLLERLRGVFDAWPRPVMNAHAERIAALTRDGVAKALAGHPRIVAPATRRLGRRAVAATAEGASPLDAELAFPMLLRPVGSHAGHGLERIDDRGGLGAYLADHREAEFYASAFHDYRGADGLFRKYRVVFIDGRPFLAHMAVSQRWMVHYANADMAPLTPAGSANRAEEAGAMAGFDEGFAARHAEAFADLTDAFGLDYVGIDCAELPDGRLLLFEADVGMIVHAMDPEDLYPYKKPAMQKLFAAFVGALSARSI
jgi:hypothetical protein